MEKKKDQGKVQEKTLRYNLIAATVIRFAVMVYGLWQDSVMLVKYTDYDYHVFTDAAKFVVEGKSPYDRATYRYTPILAWLLAPNIIWNISFGKILFIACDIFVGYLIYTILKLRSCDNNTAIFCAQLWLLNPLPIAISTRGNAESLLAVLVLFSLYCIIMRDGALKYIGFIVYGVTIHFKIYPIIYSLPIYLMLSSEYTGTASQCSKTIKRWCGLDIWPNWTRITLISIVLLIITGTTYTFYHWYGQQFLEETYLYHITRQDTRHNFSVYFYMLYLTTGVGKSIIQGLLAFLPQLVLLFAISFKYYEDIPFCCFLQTFVFVTFNKVCTSQYFLWYLCLLPLVIPTLRLKLSEVFTMIILWFIGQGLWLLPAYYLEFEGRNTFLFIWMAGLVFFVINIWILYKLTVAYTYSPIYKNAKIQPLLPSESLSFQKLFNFKKKEY